MKGLVATIAVAVASLGAPEDARAQPGGPTIEVVRVTPEGVAEPLADAEVVLETWTQRPGRRSEPTLGDCFVGRTGADGRVAFPGVTAPEDGELRASVVRDGVSFRSKGFRRTGGGPAEVRVYDVTGRRGTLSASIQTGLDLREAFLIVDQTVELRNDGRRVVDLARGEQGLRMPVPLPAVGEASVDVGLIPPGTARQHMATRATPPTGRFVFERGGLYFEGPVLPGEGTRLRVRYALPVKDEVQRLGFSSPVPLDRVTLSTKWSSRVAPTVVPERAFRAAERRGGGEIQRFLRIDDVPEPGEPLIVRVDRLPQPMAVITAVAWLGTALLLGLFLLAVLAGRRRDG